MEKIDVNVQDDADGELSPLLQEMALRELGETREVNFLRKAH